MVIGDEHFHAERVRGLDPGVRGDAVVHRDQEVGALVRELRDERRRQAVAVAHAVRHAHARIGVAEPRELAQDERRAGGAVRVEVADDEDARAALDVRGKQFGRRADAVERRDRQQGAQLERQLVRVADAARRVHAPQHRVQAAGQRGNGAFGPAPQLRRLGARQVTDLHRRPS